MRRFFILLMLALLAVGLVACGGSDDSDKTPGNDGDSDRVPTTKAGTATKVTPRATRRATPRATEKASSVR